MGIWSYNHHKGKRLSNKELKEAIIREEFSACNVHHISIPTWGEAYVAYTHKKDPENLICAAVVLIKWNNGTEVGFKVMGEECGPNANKCPKKILKMLSPLKGKHYSKWAEEWREDCWKNFKKRG